jgi:Pyridoxamine 5'-phosphate oxidase
VDPQEITEELEHPGARNLLDSATLLRLAYNGSDGFPRVIPIGFYWNGNQIVVCTAATAPKVKALSARPNIAMTIDVGDTPTEAKALLVRGLASVDIVDGVPDEYIAASTKGTGRRPRHGVRAPGQVAVRPDGTYLHRAGMGAFLRLRCWPHAVLPDEAGGRRLAGRRRATSPNLTSSFVLCEPLQSGPLATRIGACG